jgi:hypothetical protein
MWMNEDVMINGMHLYAVMIEANYLECKATLLLLPLGSYISRNDGED